MTISKLCFLGALLVVWSSSGNSQIDMSAVNKKASKEVEELDVEPERACPSIAQSQLEGSWTIYRSAGSFTYGDEIVIRRSSDEGFKVSDSSDSAMLLGNFTATCSNDEIAIRGTYEDHDCVHGIKIWLVDQNDVMNYDQNCDGFYEPSIKKRCKRITNKHYEKHIWLTTFHSGEGCPNPSYWDHGGTAHGGGTGGPGNN